MLANAQMCVCVCVCVFGCAMIRREFHFFMYVVRISILNEQYSDVLEEEQRRNGAVAVGSIRSMDWICGIHFQIQSHMIFMRCWTIRLKSFAVTLLA